ncbi:phage/plasmid replication protein, II/X family [Chitinolyticbacter meiyuanensis]|uniref:phage/plasmid replication protein, II/X family n=1 Tax=Chitinolyticbacter meiyuanensis TaxID=682798 RepID=UPI0011E59C2A|nr:phage/plasmid replication protein, II/X family [Chitinolyticbacter meiyuanensis]
MAVDTIKLRSPIINPQLADYLEQQCTLKQGIDLRSGEMLYEMTTGKLDGSYDSRISFRVCRDDWVNIKGRCELVPCEPYILLECSVHKVLYGQNVYGNPVDVQTLCFLLISTTELLLNPQQDPNWELPSAKYWEVRRIDWAHMFYLSPDAIAEYFRALKKAVFPRRKDKSSQHGDHSLHFPGEMTTLRLYHKGPEFRAHDLPRIRRILPVILNAKYKNMSEWTESRKVNKVHRTLRALAKIADSRLRVEVQINAPKLNYDFGDRYPLVSEITDEYLESVYSTEVQKLLKEGDSDMETVRNHEAVRSRLQSVYGTRSANNLLAFWMRLAAEGESLVRMDYSKTQFYENRKKLIDAGVSWLASNVYLLDEALKVPRDFKPFKSSNRLCVMPVRNSSLFNMNPLDIRDLLAMRDYKHAQRVAA